MPGQGCCCATPHTLLRSWCWMLAPATKLSIQLRVQSHLPSRRVAIHPAALTNAKNACALLLLPPALCGPPNVSSALSRRPVLAR